MDSVSFLRKRMQWTKYQNTKKREGVAALVMPSCGADIN